MRRPLVWVAIAVGLVVLSQSTSKIYNWFHTPPPVHVAVDLTPYTLPQRTSTGTLVRDWYFHHSVIWAWFERDFALIAKDRRDHDAAALARDCAILSSNIADTTAVRPVPEAVIDAHLRQAMSYFSTMLSACSEAQASLSESAFRNVQEYYNLGANQMHWADQLLTPYVNGDI